MNTTEIVHTLIEAADVLDEQHCYREASVLTRIAKRVSAYHFEEENPAFPAQMDSFIRGDEEEDLDADRDEVLNHSFDAPSMEGEENDPIAILEQKMQAKNEVPPNFFARMLSNAGADVTPLRHDPNDIFADE